MGKASSQRWLAERRRDPFVQQAQQAGYRSRAVFKLMEIDQRDGLLRPGMVVVDLGAAPGGWSQFAAQQVGSAGRVVATDLLAIEPLANVRFIQGDFRQQTVFAAICEMTNGPVDLVLSDMAPNVSGHKAIDQPSAMHLAELALDFAQAMLKPRGQLLVKLFHGQGFDRYVKELRATFSTVRMRKPNASRSRSNEVYALAQRR